MKITKRQLKRIIKEAISGNDPQSLYDRKMELEKDHSSHFYYIRTLGEKTYTGLIDLLSKMNTEDDSYNNYGNFLKIVRTPPYNVDPSAAYKMWFGTQRVGASHGPQARQISDIMDDFDEYEAIRDQFENVSGTNQTDRVYGRKRTNIVHKPTGTVVKSSTDRKGSLGS